MSPDPCLLTRVLQGRQADAAQIDLSLTAWQRLRDTDLIAKAKLLHQHLSAAIAEKSPTFAEYGLDKADATALAKETSDYEALVADPSVAISPAHRAAHRPLPPLRASCPHWGAHAPSRVVFGALAEDIRLRP